MNADLLDFLRARLDEDERVARSAAPGPWAYQDVDSVGGGRVCDPTVSIADLHYEQPGQVDPRIRRTVLSEEADGTGAHIVRYDPARVLAEVEGKRRVLEWCDAAFGSTSLGEMPAPARLLAMNVLAALALPYANEPGYRGEWRQ